jgi:thiol-disulfide isomerase/thioredoxin
MVSDMAALKQQYDEPLNFVMLNVDNGKWLPELVEYRVDGIPHFVFLNDRGEAIAQTIGEQPRSVMEENIKALIASRPLPYAQNTGSFSSFSAPVAPAKSATDPRSHGGLPQG